MNKKNILLNVILLFIFFKFDGFDASSDYSLVCRKGYRVSSIKRINSKYQRFIAGSMLVECERLLNINSKQIKCETLENTPQCNGWPEGCTNSQWLAGFHGYSIENSTNVVLLDPICCSSPNVEIDALSCASERLNTARQPFEHKILSNDLVYRGMQCWHQYNSTNTIVDFVWKLEICQYNILENAPTDIFPTPQNFLNQALLLNGTDKSFSIGKQSNIDEGESLTSELFSLSTSVLSNCPSCECYCGIDLCGNGVEPIRLIHKAIHPKKCSCDCACKYECL